MPRAFLAACLCAMSAALLGCAGVPLAPVAVPAALLDDSRFATPAEPIDAADVFAISEAMKRYVREDMASLLRRLGPQRGLLEALAKRTQLKLDYDAETTRTAAQAFDARVGNCLALTIMTASFAQELGLPVRFQMALDHDTWSRSGDLYLRGSHVNLVIGSGRNDDYMTGLGGLRGSFDTADITVDFLPAAQLKGLRVRPIDRDTVIAMFMNNRAVEVMVRGRLDQAYAWASAAIRQQPGYLPAYNTLGVVYLRHGDLALAERALAHVLAREPTDVQAMTNLAQLLEGEGRLAESKALRLALRQAEPHPPFDDFNRGREAMSRGDFTAARALFERELERDPYYHEFHFWLAVANVRLGDDAEARKHLALAGKYSSSRGDRDLYAAKLARLGTTHQ